MGAHPDPQAAMESIAGIRLPEQLSDIRGKKSCCAALYELEPVRLLLGDTLHPGGLALTYRLAKLIDIRPDDLVLDVASGRGASALAVARSFHCDVVGVDLGLKATAEATRVARESGSVGQVSFVCGDGENFPLRAECFDAALCECSMSLFPDKWRGMAEVARLLKPGGRLGVSDVVVEPGCFTMQNQPEGGSVLLSQALSIIEKVKVLVEQGGIGYWLFVVEKMG